MTAYRFPSLTCDSCGEIYDGAPDIVSVRELRALALGEGWSTGWGRDRLLKDFCGRCRKVRNGEPRWPMSASV